MGNEWHNSENLRINNESPITEEEKQKAESLADGEVPERSIQGVRWFLVVAAIYATGLLYGLDTTIAADVQASVTNTFQDVSKLAWVGAGFPLGSVIVGLPYGVLYSTFNMKWLYIIGLVLFEAGSALCGGAPTMNALICGRVLAGIGGTGIYVGGLNYLSCLTTPQERGGYVSAISFFWGVGCVLGPIVGGEFSQSTATWRWAFYINLVIGAITAPIYLFGFPSIQPTGDESFRSKIFKIDGVGTALSFAMWCVFAFVFVSAGSLWAWSDGRTIAMLVVCGVLLLAYATQQYFCLFTNRDTRSFPGHLIPDRTQTLLYITTSCSITTIFIPTYYIPIYFQFVRNDTAIDAAVRLLPFLLVLICTSFVSGYLLSRVKYYMPTYLVSGILLTISGALFYIFIKPSTAPGTIYGISIVCGLGTGMVLQSGYTIATLTVKPNDAARAISYQYFGQMGGIVISLVIAGQIFQSVATENLSRVLSGLGYSSADIAGAVAGVQSTVISQLDPEKKAQAILAITEAMRLSFTLVIIAGGIMTVSALLMKREKLF
ncbi:hypothetical protein NQ176_g845 [Zarea fungicola]|uniref:Uncharacterized protein n=1 Tax=Zarea fungicola TaxID=93591 RepID=A0ACC1NV42_9HYPO|nr:hypothetical protein NQ176_g845 [Lecanicillium fungicola]